MKKIVGVDLFCGIGGLTYGLKQAGIDIRVGVDNDPTCKYAFEKNNGAKFICEDIKNVRGKDLLKHFPSKSYKLIAGCAPCQPYSTHQNKNVDKRKHSKYVLS
ncbi:DNA cytosine methyltransferase [Mycoplasma sp. ATU-Cv-508]|uniref:DNA cytosine methyltransferase n=1 Tax=Mycoplasma sp. ATU-Cv-508 TaxID=2048001 RepID=UPI001374A3A1